MAKNYSITFMSLRAGTVYQLYIGGGSGTAVALKGGAQPFTTQEDDSDDQFTPIRTQSGYIRIIDDGYAADGVTAFNWKDLIPQTNTSRPVTLTAGGTVVWQGFMQSQNFSGELYGNPQEREFPVHCVLSALNGVDVPVTLPSGMQMILNFATMLGYIFGRVPVLSGNILSNGNITFQAYSRAQTILGAKFDWSNFLTTDEDGNAAAQYTLYQVLEDFCRFWGYTVRTYQRDIIFTCADDTTENTAIRFASESALANISGTYESSMYSTIAIPNSFVSADNDDTVILGPGKAEVKADCNSQKEIVEFAPYEVEKTMENTPPGYTWVSGGEDLVGYFTTPYIYSFDCPTLTGTGKFCRRQIYSTQDQTDSTETDLICFTGYEGSTVINKMQTKVPRSYGGGSIKMNCQCFHGAEALSPNSLDNVKMQLGIGMDRASAKWFYCYVGLGEYTVNSGWKTAAENSGVIPSFRQHLGAQMGPLIVTLNGWKSFPAIPVADNLYGYLFIEFYGCSEDFGFGEFELGKFSVEFSREKTELPTSITSSGRARTMADKRRSTIRYSAVNNNGNLDKWNADCIFATDNNAEYGYGLLMTSSGGYFGQMYYGSVQKYPEQHLCDRVSAYYATAKRMVTGSMDSNASVIGTISPRNKATLDGSTFHPIAIGRNWRDDESIITLLQL